MTMRAGSIRQTLETQGFSMSRRCELTGKSAQVGHKVSHSNIKTKRRFLPNLLNVTMISDALGRSVKLRVSANALKTVDHRGGLDLAERDAAHAHGQTAAPAESAFEQHNVAAGQERGIGDVVVRTSPDREVTGARPPDEEAPDVARLVEAALRDCDQSTGERQALRNEDQGLNSLVGRQRAQSRRQRDRPAAGKEALLAVIEADDLMNSLDADIESATILCDRFGVIPTARR